MALCYAPKSKSERVALERIYGSVEAKPTKTRNNSLNRKKVPYDEYAIKGGQLSGPELSELVESKPKRKLSEVIGLLRDNSKAVKENYPEIKFKVS